MGLGDEIMALGRAEAMYERLHEPVAICRIGGYPREHDAWIGNPAWDSKSRHKIIDGGGARPYITRWGGGSSAIYNLKHRPRAGRIWLNEKEKAHCTIEGPFAVVAPYVKLRASPNKDWGAENWEKVIENFPIPVYQLIENERIPVINGARGFVTPHFRHAAAVIERAQVVMCNEGGSHHMAASMKTPAVVFFGSFIPPQVTGYDSHVNIAVETPHGFCGKFERCKECAAAKQSITPDYVRSKVDEVLNEKRIHWI